MSRAYRIRQTIRVQETLRKELSVSDEICTELELLEILTPEAMGELLRGALRERGFIEDGKEMVRQRDGITVRIDPNTAEVRIHIDGEEKIDIQGGKEATVFQDTPEAEKKRIQESLRDVIRKELDQRVEDREGRLQEKVSTELEASLGGLSTELDQVVNAVTREALKRKAASLGQIKEMSEDPQTGSLTITVQV